MAERIARQGEAGMEGMRLSVLSDWLEARSLALVPPGETVLISQIAHEATERRYQSSGFCRGATARCERNGPDRVTVRLDSGESLDLALEDAWFVWVTAPPSTAPLSRIAAGPSKLR